MRDGNKARVFYMGRRIKSNKIRHLYCYDDNDVQFTLHNKLGEYPVGAVIEVFEHEDYFKPPYIGVGTIQDKSELLAWQMEDQLSYLQHKSQQHWKKLSAGESDYEILINDINSLIKSLPAQQRKSFIFKLISDIDFNI